MRLAVSLPERGVDATITLHDHLAPIVCRAVYESLVTPLETRTAHACFDGHAAYCYLHDFPAAPPVQNSTMRPVPGDVMFYYAPARSYSWLNEDQERLSPAGLDADLYEFSFIYGPVNLIHAIGEAFYGSLIGRVTAGFDELAEALGQTLDGGSTPLILGQADAT